VLLFFFRTMEAYFFKSPTGSPCLWMCVLFYFSFVCLHVCAYASKFKVHCGSAFEPGTSRLPRYCAPPACVPAVIRRLAVWRHNKKKKSPPSTAGMVPGGVQ